MALGTKARPRSDLRQLATYLATHWPTVQQGTPVETALWLLEHLRRIDTSGALPGIGDEGEVVRGVPVLPVIRKVIQTLESV